MKEISSLSRRTGFPVMQTNESGELLSGYQGVACSVCGGPSPHRRMEAARQTLAWGEPVIGLCCDEGLALWAVPLTHNAEVTGALVVEGVDLESRGGKDGMPARVRVAANELLNLAVEKNWINVDTLRMARRRAEWERQRFLALEASKEHWLQDDLRTLYLREEPALLVAIKEGDTGQARAVLNRILSGIYAVAGKRMDLLKSCIIELVVMMSRAAVEAGADPVFLFGANYQKIADLAAIDSDEDLAVWVRQTLENLIEVIRRNEHFPQSLLLQRALGYMRENLDRQIRRDEVAQVAGVSAGHFSKLMTERMGKSFSDLLTQMRIERAKELILQTDLNFTAIGLECGFFDQSHLNRHFRKATGLSPGDYRKKFTFSR